jgi:hypothetical protein
MERGQEEGNDMPKRNTPEAFWQKVDRSGQCWIWTGYRLPGGYGRLTWRGTHAYAHRISWVITRGPIPGDLSVLHRCDNPPCVRPDHLFLGTQADNMADRDQKGRHRTNPRRGESCWRSRMTEESVCTARAMRSSGHTLRSIGTYLGVHHNTIEAVVNGRSWKHVHCEALS